MIYVKRTQKSFTSLPPLEIKLQQMASGTYLQGSDGATRFQFLGAQLKVLDAPHFETQLYFRNTKFYMHTDTCIFEVPDQSQCVGILCFDFPFKKNLETKGCNIL